MARSRVPIRGSIGKAILTGQTQTIVQQTVVQQITKSGNSGVGGVASTIWPLISQIPIPVLDLAALTTMQVGLLTFNGTNVIERSLAVNAPLTVANPTGAAGNPTVSLTTAALTKTDDTNVTLTLGGTPASALVAAASLTLGWTGQLSVPRGGSGAAALTGYLKGTGITAFTASASIPYTDLTGTPTIPTDIHALTFVTEANETAAAPNSFQLIAGTNITFDTTTPNQLKISASGGGGSGTVTSVDASVPSFLTISGNPITTAGTLAFDLATQNANLTFVGPATGSAAKPTFRALVIADIPTIPAAHTSGFATVATTGAYSDLSGLPGSALTKTDDTNVTLTLGGTPLTALLHAASLTLGWTGQLSVARGGSGVGTLTGYLKGNGTAAFTAAAAVPVADITGLAAIATSGSATDLSAGTVASARLPTASTSVLGAVKVDGTSITISGGVISSTGGASGANPTASVGLTAVNGTATTFLRSDGAPALSQAIVPTWTGAHLFQGTGAAIATGTSSLSIQGGTGGLITRWNASAATDAKTWRSYIDASGTLNFGALNDAGTTEHFLLQATRSGLTVASILLGNATDTPPISATGILQVRGGAVPPAGVGVELNYDGAIGYLYVFDRGAGVFKPLLLEGTTISLVGTISGLGPVAGAQVNMTPDASGFTGTLTGMTAGVTNTCVWSRNGNQVTLSFGAASGTSNLATFTLTGLPAAIQPARSQWLDAPCGAFLDGGSSIAGTKIGAVLMNAGSGTVTFDMNDGSGWVNSGTKAINRPFTVTYLLN